MMHSGFFGRHYETGTIVNALAAAGVTNPRSGEPYSEALALGASGGIAFGYFVFEYTGQLPHVALLTRNTFSPFGRALDNLAIRRDSRETTDDARAERNLRLELDLGNAVIVWADSYSLPYTGLCGDQMWVMRPLLVVGQEDTDFLIVDGPSFAFPISAEELGIARGRVKKDRYRMATFEAPDAERIGEGLERGMEACAALFLDKPPAGSPNNFGIVGMRHWAKMMTDAKNSKSWAKTFEPGPRLTQALAGKHGQPGVWDWIERWGSSSGADREMFADFLVEAAGWTGTGSLEGPADGFRKSGRLWQELAESAMPDAVPEFQRLKELKRRHAACWLERGIEALPEREAIREEMRDITAALSDPKKLEGVAASTQARMAETVSQIADLEEAAVRSMRDVFAGR